jgi:hypothetical protein
MHFFVCTLYFTIKIRGKIGSGVVGHLCNPSYSGGGDQEGEVQCQHLGRHHLNRQGRHGGACLSSQLLGKHRQEVGGPRQALAKSTRSYLKNLKQKQKGLGRCLKG